MRVSRLMLVPVVAGALVLPGCMSKPSRILGNEEKRREVVEALVTDPTARQEVIDRLVGSPTERNAVFERILKDEGVAGALIEKIIAEDRGRALVAAKVSADSQGSKTFIRMLMLTGAMGEAMTQQQAESLGLGEPFAYGNQRRTMLDLKAIGANVEAWAKQHQGRFPVCEGFGRVDGCLAGVLGEGSVASLRLKDAWGNPVLYNTDREGSQYVLVSYASDGKDDGLGKVGPTESYNCDIVFSNGDFIQWPGWIRKSDLR